MCFKIHSDKRTTTVKIQTPFKNSLCASLVVSPCSTHGFLQAPQAFFYVARDESHYFRDLSRAAVESFFCFESLGG